MKANKVKRKRSFSALALVAVILFATMTAGIAFTYSKLKSLWIQQYVVTDVTSQASCADGTMVKGDTVLDKFGIRNGANLATIDFAAKRREILAQFPQIRAISITRHLPGRVTIALEERQPVVRLSFPGRKAPTGRVADSEGVVFTCRRGTNMLPTIRERETATTPIGHHLAGRALAALQLIETCRDVEFSSLGILDADASKKDFILATLGNYAQAKIAWNGMDGPTESNRAHLIGRLRHLQKAIQSNVGSDAKIWDATEPDRIYADTRETLL